MTLFAHTGTVQADTALARDAVDGVARLDAVTGIGDPSIIINARLAVAFALHHDGRCRAAAHTVDVMIGEREFSADPSDDTCNVMITQAVIYAGCGLTSAAVHLLQRHHRLLTALPAGQVDELVDLLTYIEAEHPRVCELASHRSARPPRRAFWHHETALARRGGTVQHEGRSR
jgi:hypothetical protein